MRKIFHKLNIFLLIVTCAMTAYYDHEGGLWLKGLTGSGFVVMGLLNLIYAVASEVKDLRYPIFMALGLAVCLTGDIVLNIAFLPGVAMFAVGHIFYIVAFCGLQKPKVSDLTSIGALSVLACGIIKLVPILEFGSALVENLCVVYGLVISCMVGKAIANFFHQRNKVNTLLLIGSALFYFSDVMLVLCRFGDAPEITDTLCLFSYFPAQCLLAYSIHHNTPPNDADRQ